MSTYINPAQIYKERNAEEDHEEVLKMTQTTTPDIHANGMRECGNLKYSLMGQRSVAVR